MAVLIVMTLGCAPSGQPKQVGSAPVSEAEKSLAEWIPQLNDPDAKKRFDAVLHVPSVTQTDEVEVAVTALLGVLQDEDDQVRSQAVYALYGFTTYYGGAGTRRAPMLQRDVLPVFVRCLDDPYWGVRRCGALGLSAFGPAAKVAVPALTKTVGDDDLRVRYFAIQALGKIGPDSEPAIPSLVAALDAPLPEGYAYDHWFPDPHTIAQAIGSIGPAALPALSKALEHGNPKVREAARYVLTRFSPDSNPSAP